MRHFPDVYHFKLFGRGDREQHGQNFAIGHLLYMVTIKPKFGNFLMLVRPTVVKMGSKRVGDRGQVTDFGHGQWAGDRGRPNNSKWYSIWHVKQFITSDSDL